MTKNQCLESLKQLSAAVESFARSCGLEGVTLDLEQHASDLSYAVSNWLIGEEVSARLNAASEQTAQCISRVEEMKKLLSSQKQQLQEQEMRIQDLDAQAASLREQNRQTANALLGAIKELIVMRDSLLARADLLRESGVPETDDRFKLVTVSLRETAQLMNRMGVTILEDEGIFDPTRHSIVDTLPAHDPGMVDHIARVFRPGYQYEGNILRGQEVIIYVKD